MDAHLQLVLVFVINTVVVAITVVIHYEFLYHLTRWIPKIMIPHRYRIVVGVIGTLVAHAVEIWVFAVAFYFMHHAAGWGELIGHGDGTLFSGTVFDCVYYSFAGYSTLGFGDITPQGDLRYLTGIEALTGLVLITWSASFLYLEMQSNWELEED